MIIIFLIVVLLESYYIGKYVALKQSFFKNKYYLTLSMGILIYLSSTILSMVPLLWTNIDVVYYMIIILTKDILIIVFLVSNRHYLKFSLKMKDRFILLGMSIAILIATLYINPLTGGYKEVSIDHKDSVNFFKLYEDVIKHLTMTDQKTLQNYFLMPLFSIFISSISFGIFRIFINKWKTLQISVAALLTLGSYLLFNYGLQIQDIAVFFIIMFGVACLYNVVVFSRRRYGSLYALVVIVSYGLNPNSYWAILFTTISCCVVYIFLKKSRASLFTFQLFGPVLLVSTLSIMSFSPALSWIVLIFGITFYLAIFLVGKVGYFDYTNRVFKYLYWIIPFFALVIVAVISFFYEHKIESFNEITTSVSIIGQYKNGLVNIIFGSVWFSLFMIFVVYVIYCFIAKEEKVYWKLMSLLILSLMVFAFNPMVFAYIRKINVNATTYFAPLLVMTILFTGTPTLLNSFKKKKARKSKQNKYLHK